MKKTYDVIVIGSGPGGYVCALRCAQLGMRVACIERWQDDAKKQVLGGTCLNVGCIPSKALLDSSHHYWHLNHGMEAHGVKAKQSSLDLGVMMGRKDGVVEKLARGVRSLLDAASVDVIHGDAQLLSNKAVQVKQAKGGDITLSAPNIVLATGSVPSALKACPVDQKHIVDSTGALAFDKVPKRLAIIGAGVIGLELGSVWSRLGSSVTLYEALPDFLPTADSSISKAAARVYAKQGLDILLDTRVLEAKASATVKVQYEREGKKASATFDKLIVAVGRAPASDGLLAKDSGVQLDERGFAVVDEHCQSAVEGVYAIGDLVRGPMLAHKASEEGVMVAERIADKKPHIEYELVPWVIYTHPEIAWVGKTRQALDAEGIPYKVGEFPFAALGRPIASDETEGKVVVLAHAETDRILGCHIMGAHAAELIQQVVLSMEFCGSAEDLALSVFAHPTFSEAIHEAALALDGRALHMPMKRTSATKKKK